MDRPDLRLVDYFVAVAEELHFGRAAERLHIAQPSLSQQIRRLEQQLGVTLLERTSRRVELTPAGSALLSEGREALRQAQRAVRTTRAAGTAQLVVGFYGSAGCALLPKILREFGDQHPAFEISVRELLLGSLDDVAEGKVNLAFARLLPGQTELDVEILTEEPRLAALACAHPLATRETITFADLSGERFIVNPAVPADDPPRRWLDEQRRRGLPGRIATRAGSVQEVITLVASGRGVCLVPSAVAECHPRGDLVYVPVNDADPAVVSIARRRGRPTPPAEVFIQTARRIAAASRLSG